MDRRGQGISINVIVIAAIALLVLVILSVVVLRVPDKLKIGTACDNQPNAVCRSENEFGIRFCDVDEKYDGSATCKQSTSSEKYYCCRTI